MLTPQLRGLLTLNNETHTHTRKPSGVTRDDVTFLSAGSGTAASFASGLGKSAGESDRHSSIVPNRPTAKALKHGNGFPALDLRGLRV